MICLPMMWYGLVISSFKEFILIDLAYAHAYLRLSLDDLLFLSSDITSMPDSMLLCRSA